MEARPPECPRCGPNGYITKANGDCATAAICRCRRDCPTCGGVGYVFETNDGGYSSSVPCHCTELSERVRLYKRTTLPARYHAKTLEEFEANGSKRMSRLKVKLYKYQKEFLPGELGLLLEGGVGTGKTHLLAALFRHFTLEKGFPCRFVEFSHLLAELKEGYDSGKSERELISPLVRVPVLGIDELGKGRGTEWELTIIDEIISKRYNSSLSTFFTTNYSLDEPSAVAQDPYSRTYRDRAVRETLCDRVGERILSRLYEMCTFVNLPAQDYRKRSLRPAMVEQRV